MENSIYANELNSKQTKRLLLIAVAFPILFILLAISHNLLQYFRISKEYRYAYKYGESIRFFLQLLLMLASLLWGITNLLRQNTDKRNLLIATFIGLSPLLYLIIRLCFF